MPVIQSVELTGFQSHIDSHFFLGSGLNVITGPSDAGKTATIRAVRWVAFNEPQGESFVNEKVGEAIVRIKMDNGAVITKTRRKGKTSYLVQTDEGDEGSLFEKSEVPEEVKKLLGIEKQHFGDFETALNFAFQLDAPFLISETASAGAKILGKLAGTESVDLAIKGVSKDTHATRAARTQAERDIDKAAANLLEFTGIDQAKQSLEAAEYIVEEIQKTHDKKEHLIQQKHQHEQAEAKILTHTKKLESLSHIPALAEHIQDIEKTQNRYDRLQSLYSQYRTLWQRISDLGETLNQFQYLQQASDGLAVTEAQSEKLGLLISLSQSYIKYDTVLNKNIKIFEKVAKVDAADDLLRSVSERMFKFSNLKELAEKLQSTTFMQERAIERLHSFRHLEDADDVLQRAEANLEAIRAMKEVNTTHERAEIDLGRVISALQSAEADIVKRKEEEQKAWEEAGGICPLCEQPHGDGCK